MQEIYFDNSATTMVCEKATNAAIQAMLIDYGNPASVHAKGAAAFHQLNQARSAVADLLAVDSDELYFTSCGTESNNIVINGIAKAAGKRGKMIISAVEHPSVYEPIRHLTSLGYQAQLVPVDHQGIINLSALSDMLDQQTALVSIMHINNETGAVQPIKLVGETVRSRAPQALFHIDAVQSFGRIPVDVADCHADAVSASGHKIHAPKGVGMLWLRQKWNLAPLMHGGGQERGLRAGTENISAIMAFAAAAEECYTEMEQKYLAIEQVKKMLLKELDSRGIDYRLNSPIDAAAHIVNISFPGIRSEIMLNSLSAHNLFVSAGSACTSQSSKASRILTAMNLEPELIDSALRFSFCRYNTVAEARTAAQIIETVLEDLSLLITLNKRKKEKVDK